MTGNDPVLDEISASDARYGIDARAARPCPACKVPGEPFVDEHGRRRVDYTHDRSCWLHPPAGVPPRSELDYLDGAAAPFEISDYENDGGR
jgi:hypothetical protein